ncbi:MAG: hypothetical protein IPP49_12855 [Saprospiraceae bacterium]|nr:hypothetical protein [Saprospiraceae bacterium]
MKNFKHIHSRKGIFTFLLAGVVLSLLVIACKKEHKSLTIQDMAWMQGTWATPDSMSVETWAVQDGEMKGNVYFKRAGKITENLRIFKSGNTMLYEATVFSQNDGKPVLFALDNTTPDSLHFVNMNHDYPNHIIYKRLNDTTLYCRTYGISEDGYAFVMKKLKE